MKLSFHRYVVGKLVLFEFVNSFLALFYIAFYLRDIVMLKSQVFTMLLVQQIVNQVWSLSHNFHSVNNRLCIKYTAIRS